MNFPSKRDDCKKKKKKEKNNVTIALNVLYAKKQSYSFNDSKWRKMTLSCSKKTIGIIKRNIF